MRVLAIDPGTNESAYVSWNNGILNEARIIPNIEMRDYLRSANACLPIWEVIAIEMVACMGMPVGREVMETIFWIGRFYEHCPEKSTRRIYRRDIKLHHCGSARAKDANIRQALIDKYGAPGTKKAQGVTYGLKSHLWSAFAIATFISETAKQ